MPATAAAGTASSVMSAIRCKVSPTELSATWDRARGESGRARASMTDLSSELGAPCAFKEPLMQRNQNRAGSGRIGYPPPPLPEPSPWPPVLLWPDPPPEPLSVVDR